MKDLSMDEIIEILKSLGNEMSTAKRNNEAVAVYAGLAALEDLTTWRRK